MRGCHGSVKLDYQRESMTVKVQMASEGKRNVVKDMKTLSGGERSYVTVCFITALAHAISSPFHCMDEFDVFMDPVNRKVRCIGPGLQLCRQSCRQSCTLPKLPKLIPLPLFLLL